MLSAENVLSGHKTCRKYIRIFGNTPEYIAGENVSRLRHYLHSNGPEKNSCLTGISENSYHDIRFPGGGQGQRRGDHRAAGCRRRLGVDGGHEVASESDSAGGQPVVDRSILWCARLLKQIELNLTRFFSSARDGKECGDGGRQRIGSKHALLRQAREERGGVFTQ